MKRLKVVDSIMGSGKSSWAIDMFNSNTDKQFMYITPYLEESRRIEDETIFKRPLGSFEDEQKAQPELPEEEIRFSKLNKTIQIENFFKSGDSVTSTHQALKYLPTEVIQKYCQNYILVLDEVMNLIETISMAREIEVFLFNPQNGNDPFLLIDEGKGSITVSEYGKSYDEKKEGALTKTTWDIIDLASKGRLISIEGKTYVTEISLDMFKYFKEVYIMSYLFEGSNMCDYLQSEGFTWDKYQIIGSYTEGFKLENWCSKRARQRCIELGEKIIEPTGRKVLNWDNKLESDDISLSYSGQLELVKGRGVIAKRETLGKIIRGFFRSTGAKQNDAMYTLYMSLKKLVYVQGFTNGFIPHNKRATNNYAHKFALVYAVERNVNPQLKKHMAWKYSNETKGKRVFCPNKYRLSDMLQWIYRTRIRNGEEINLWVVSPKMRRLLNEWKQGNIF